MSNNKHNIRKKVNWAIISYLFLLVAIIVFLLIVFTSIIFPGKYKIPLTVIIFVIMIMSLYFTIHIIKLKGKIFIIIMNCLLSATMFFGSFYLSIIQTRAIGLFTEPTNTQNIRINAYVMTSEYKKSHKNIFDNIEVSSELSDYINSSFIIQKQVDNNNEEYAINDIQKQLDVSKIKIIEGQDVMSAVSTLYNGKGDVLLLNETFEDAISDIPGYENFKSDTQVIYSVVDNVQIETAKPDAKAMKDITNSSFMVFIAGSDSRETEVTPYTRTDVDILLTVDPINHQVLLISMPRDWYVKNPALGNRYDKLTHLGNSGMMNSVIGLNQEFGFDYIKNYVEVNFVTFYNIVDAVGGIDIYNPYAFTCSEKTSVGGTSYGGSYTFNEGNIHLDGNQALTYVRERHALSNGDYGRNEHQAIVLRGILSKLTGKAIISSLNSLLDKLQKNFLTNIDADDIYKLAQKQLSENSQWDFVSYHLGGVGEYSPTASMGAMELYVSDPISEQVQFAGTEMTKVMNGETIKQETLPADDQTVFLPN
jgi:LCP family protein required for cell wall assembly